MKSNNVVMKYLHVNVYLKMKIICGCTFAEGLTIVADPQYNLFKKLNYVSASFLQLQKWNVMKTHLGSSPKYS